MDQIRKELFELTQLIKNTPRNSREVVEEYHQGIIKRLDSDLIIPVPSIGHRIAHQMIWITGNKIFKELASYEEAFQDYLRNKEDLRFNGWYAWRYILKKRITNKWEWETLEVAQKQVVGVLHKHPLEELEERDFLQR